MEEDDWALIISGIWDGWQNDFIGYMSNDPKFLTAAVTMSSLFQHDLCLQRTVVLSLSHDEVVHGKAVSGENARWWKKLQIWAALDILSHILEKNCCLWDRSSNCMNGQKAELTGKICNRNRAAAIERICKKH